MQIEILIFHKSFNHLGIYTYLKSWIFGKKYSKTGHFDTLEKLSLTNIFSSRIAAIVINQSRKCAWQCSSQVIHTARLWKVLNLGRRKQIGLSPANKLDYVCIRSHVGNIDLR